KVTMQPLVPEVEGSTGLACGFFHFRGGLSRLIVDSFPDYLILRAGDPGLQAAGALFDLILAEPAGDPEQPSPLVARLVEVLFFDVVRRVAREDAVASGLRAIARRAEFRSLLASLRAAPGEPWSPVDMARVTLMSRASLYEHFVGASGQPPAQFLLS